MPRLPELEDKVAFLCRSPYAQDICGHVSTVTSFCEALGITRGRLTSATGNGSISPALSNILAARLGFDAAWTEWKHGTRHDFETRYNRLYADQAAREAARMRVAAAGNTFPTPIKPLKASRPRRHPPADELLATLQLGANQPVSGAAFPLNLELVCRSAPVGSAIVGVKRGKLRINCGPARTTSIIERLGGKAPYKLEDRQQLTIFAGGDDKHPIWIIESEAAPIGVLTLTDGICQLMDIAPGHIISADFQVYIKDLSTADAHDTNEAEHHPFPHGQSYSFVRVDREQLGAAAKNAILARLAQLDLLGDNPWATLCHDELQFDDPADRTADR
jgi:hypothetical protein